MIGVMKPKLSNCWYCERPKSASAWHGSRAVCARCEGFMAHGVICIGVNRAIPQSTIVDKVYRDGNWCVLSSYEYTRRFNKPVPDDRHAFIDAATWARAGLPKFGKHGARMHESEEGGSFGASDDAQVA